MVGGRDASPSEVLLAVWVDFQPWTQRKHSKLLCQKSAFGCQPSLAMTSKNKVESSHAFLCSQSFFYLPLDLSTGVEKTLSMLAHEEHMKCRSVDVRVFDPALRSSKIAIK